MFQLSSKATSFLRRVFLFLDEGGMSLAVKPKKGGLSFSIRLSDLLERGGVCVDWARLLLDFFAEGAGEGERGRESLLTKGKRVFPFKRSGSRAFSFSGVAVEMWIFPSVCESLSSSSSCDCISLENESIEEAKDSQDKNGDVLSGEFIVPFSFSPFSSLGNSCGRGKRT